MANERVQLRHGILVAIEGIDGAGKTTQANAIRDALQEDGIECLVTHEPTNGPWGQKLRASAATGRLPIAEELEAFVEDRRQHVREVIKPALADRKVVIVDRYYLSTAAYQGVRGVDPVDLLNRNEAFAPKPDAAFILEVPATVGVARIHARGDKQNAFEREESLRKVARVFQEIRRPYIRRVPGTAPIEVVTTVLLRRLLPHLFLALCPRTNLSECEPELCSVRLEQDCGYVGLDCVHDTPPISATCLRAITADDSMSEEQKLAAFRVMLDQG